jgi:hypothetical protein
VPRARSLSATGVPSPSKARKKKPPPGQTITAVPLAFDRSGRNAVSVGRTTLRTIFSRSHASRCSTSFCVHFSEPGAFLGQTGMTLGWLTVSSLV